MPSHCGLAIGLPWLDLRSGGQPSRALKAPAGSSWRTDDGLQFEGAGSEGGIEGSLLLQNEGVQ